MRVLVCGGRDFNDKEFLDNWLTDRFLPEYYVWTPTDDDLGYWYWDLTVIEGDATGADKLAGQWAENNYIAHERYPADWKTWGKRAGYIRNKQMLDEGQPDLVIAFPGGKGTAMMVKLAKDAGIPVEEVEYKE